MMQVVLMNQVTTKVLDNNRGSKLVPALGDMYRIQLLSCLLLDSARQHVSSQLVINVTCIVPVDVVL